MRNNHLTGLFLATIACIYAACTIPSVQARSLDPDAPAVEKFVPHIERIDCRFTAPLGDAAVCVMAWMPMSYGDLDEDGVLPEDAPRVGVHLTLLENFTSNPEPNPLVVIAGGPGQAGSDMLVAMGNAIEQRRNRSVVLYDQRGTGLSVPRLDCTQLAAAELDENPFNNPTFDPEVALAQRIHACRDGFIEQGIDLSAFDTRHATIDLRQIRKALGLKHWNLFGTSYGTRVALDAMRVDPEGIRAVVLNSTLPTATQFDAHHLGERPRIFERLYADCAADEGCTANYADLRGSLRRVAAHLEEAPIRLQFRDPETRAIVRKEVAWPDIMTILYGHMSFAASSAAVPRFIAELAQVVDGRLSLDDDQVARMFQSITGKIVDSMALGMHLSVKCREDFAGLDGGALAGVMERHAFYFPDRAPYAIYEKACPIWDVGLVDPSFAEPVESGIPTLRLSGDVDPLTPIVWAKEAASGLPNAQMITFRGVGHDVFGSVACARVIMANFLDAPESPVDAVCARNTRPRFEF